MLKNIRGMPRRNIHHLLKNILKVLPDVQSPVAVVIYTDTHTYKQKVLLYSKFMFNSKATANGDRYVREYLKRTWGFF